MIEIKRVDNINLAQKICNDNEIKFQPQYHVIATLDGEKPLNYAVFDYQKDVGNILAIGGFEDDIDLLDGLCRAILNIMDIHGVKVVYLPLKYEKIAKHVGFSKQNSSYKLELEGFFKCCCNHKTKGE